MTSIVHNLYGLETLSSLTDSKTIVGSMDIAALQNLTGMGVVCESSALRNHTFEGGEGKESMRQQKNTFTKHTTSQQ